MKNLLYIVFLFVFVSACSTKPENKPYCWDDDLHRRLLTDFCLTEAESISTSKQSVRGKNYLKQLKGKKKSSALEISWEG